MFSINYLPSPETQLSCLTKEPKSKVQRLIVDEASEFFHTLTKMDLAGLHLNPSGLDNPPPLADLEKRRMKRCPAYASFLFWPWPC